MDISFALAHLPGHETAYLGGDVRTILAWGCGSEEVAAAVSRALPQTQVSSFDSSQSAAAGPEFDVIVTSDCLERVEQPLALIEKQLQACKSLYIALTVRDVGDPQKWRVHAWFPIPDKGCNYIGTFYGDSFFWYAFGG